MSVLKPTNHRKPWTAKDDKILIDGWLIFNISTLARRLKRTMVSVELRAKTLKLGRAGRHGVIYIKTLMRKTGYSRDTIKNAITALGIQFKTIATTSAEQHRRRRGGGHYFYGIDEEDYDKLVEYLKKHQLYTIIPRAGLKRGPKGMWGVGNHGDCCVKCGRNDKRHEGKGMCLSCYVNAYKRARKWNVGRRAACCIECGTNERPYHSKNMCERCYTRLRMRAKRKAHTPSPGLSQAALLAW